MSKLTLMRNVITRTAGRTGLVLSKYSPEILMGTGIVGVIAGTVLACRATLKVESVLEEANEKIEKINFAKETVDEEKYSEKDYKKDLTVTYVQTGVEFVKLYAPAITLGVAGIGCILGAHNIMKKRNLALVAAYKLVEQSFSDYRKRVVDEFGEEKDREFKYGVKKVKKVEIDENGETKVTEIEVVNPDGVSQYAKYFDESSIHWSETPEYNLLHLTAQQNWANDLLRTRGHVFLNEVYDMLGIPRTQAGSIVGWKKGYGDDYIDFGIYNYMVEDYRDDRANDTIGEERRDFVNGYRKAILLDFNVAGVIYDMI
jgi:hypothetical protein